MLPLGKIEHLLQEHGWQVTNKLLENLIILMTQLEEVISIGTITVNNEIMLKEPILSSLKDVLNFYLLDIKRVIFKMDISLTSQKRFLVLYDMKIPNISLTINSGNVFLSYEEMVFLLFLYFIASVGFENFKYTFNATTKEKEELNKFNYIADNFYQFLRS